MLRLLNILARIEAAAVRHRVRQLANTIAILEIEIDKARRQELN